MTTYFLVPGLFDSGPDHWQTHLSKSGGNFIKIEQKDWLTPDCNDWTAAIDAAVSQVDWRDAVLIGHSYGCAAIAHWVDKYRRVIKGALLVAPSDLITPPDYVFPGTNWEPFPMNRLPFKSIVVASANDIWVTLERATLFAHAWGSELINIGAKAHINVDAGFGPWPEAVELLKKFE